MLPLIAACTLALPGRASRTEAVNPITTGTVAVTSLDAPAVSAPQAAPAAAAPIAAVVPVAQGAVPAPAQSAAEVAPEVTPAPLTPQELACRAEGGSWSRFGTTAAYICSRPTADAGKSCRRQTDCETQCLARSRTCAPVTPLTGCHPILQADGSEVTLCID